MAGYLLHRREPPQNKKRYGEITIMTYIHNTFTGQNMINIK